MSPAPNPQPSLPHDIYSLVDYPTPWYVYALSLAASLLIAGLLYKLVRVLSPRYQAWRRGKNAHLPADPWDVLRDRLQALPIDGDFALAAQMHFFYELSLILREALERYASIPALASTLAELRVSLTRQVKLPTKECEQIMDLLQRADLVKFAAMPAGVEEAAAAKSKVLEWLQTWRQTPIAEDLPLPITNEQQQSQVVRLSTYTMDGEPLDAPR